MCSKCFSHNKATEKAGEPLPESVTSAWAILLLPWDQLLRTPFQRGEQTLPMFFPVIQRAPLSKQRFHFS